MYKFVLAFLVLFLNCSNVLLAQDSKLTSISSDSIGFTKKYIQEKSKLTGNYDLYDEKIDKVRNLILIQIPNKQDELSKQIINAEFRDIKTGEIVVLNFNLAENNGQSKIGNVKIKEIKNQMQNQVVSTKKDFSLTEIQEIITAHIKKRSQFTKTYGLYDEKSSKMRNLEFVKFKEGMRHFGVLYITTVEFKDVDSSEILELDMTVKNKEGKLDVETIKIVKISKTK